MASKPTLIVSSLDIDRIEALLDNLSSTDFPSKASLQAELDRADVLEPADMPPTVVTMNSTVRFSILETGKTLELTLVYPREADGNSNKVSILAPVGIALLGLSVGDELAWPGLDGKTTTVRVTEIVFQPERAGEMHR